MGSEAQKVSTNDAAENTVEATHEYFFPDLGVVVEATDSETAEKLARKQVDEPKQDNQQ